MEITNPPTADCVMRVHRATHLGILEARQFIATQPAQLTERILRAAEIQAGVRPLRDPIEDAPATAAAVAAALARAAVETDADLRPGYFRGRCYAEWHRAERILRQDFGLEWYSPARMNPGCCFD